MRSPLPIFFELVTRLRRPLVVLIHLVLSAASNYLAFLLRFDWDIPHPQRPLATEMLPWLLLVRGLTFVPFRLYQGLWRYTSVWDLGNIIAGVLASTAIFYTIVHYVFQIPEYSRSVFIVDSLLLICFMGGIRMGRRVYREIQRQEGRKRVLVYGAGDAGEMIARDIRKQDKSEYLVVGFVDDDVRKLGRRIHGVPVLGSRANIPEIIRNHQPSEILIAIPSASAATLRAILRALEPQRVRVTTLPSIGRILDGSQVVSLIRDLSVEDLLGRDRVGLDVEPLRRFVSGRRVLVTGAGGSIGSELCRQLAKLGPSRLIMLDRYENGLHAIRLELEDHSSGPDLVPTIADVTDEDRIADLLGSLRPQVVFHAAAHKHVPLMEENPCEAVKNNVRGTRVMAEAAARFGVDRFILISTDKAVNPTNVMGASKRLAELVLLAQPKGDTSYSIVRFGNVLGSNGSVVPRFMEQIRKGGPVTVTDPEVRRFFMLIPEAVQLVLHAAAHAETSTIYVLEMGEPVRLLDVARDMIRASGFIPDEDIAIQFIGLRPGEKLYEELVGRAEQVKPSSIDKVLCVTARTTPRTDTMAMIASIESQARQGDAQRMLLSMRLLIPEFEAGGDSSEAISATAMLESAGDLPLP